MNSAKTDRRIERTRATLLNAFVSLFFERDYDAISVADIVERANVGRSTFYEHFRGKEALLAVSHRRPFGLLCVIVDQDADLTRLQSALDHFWENRSRAPSTRNLALRRALGRTLASMIFERLQARTRHAATRVAPDRLRWSAVAIAELVLGTIAVWLAGELSASTGALADMLYGQAQALARLACGV